MSTYAEVAARDVHDWTRSTRPESAADTPDPAGPHKASTLSAPEVRVTDDQGQESKDDEEDESEAEREDRGEHGAEESGPSTSSEDATRDRNRRLGRALADHRAWLPVFGAALAAGFAYYAYTRRAALRRVETGAVRTVGTLGLVTIGAILHYFGYVPGRKVR